MRKKIVLEDEKLSLQMKRYIQGREIFASCNLNLMHPLQFIKFHTRVQVREGV